MAEHVENLLKEGVQRPDVLVDIFRIGMDAITTIPDGGLRIGANVRNSVASDHPVIRERYTDARPTINNGHRVPGLTSLCVSRRR